MGTLITALGCLLLGLYRFYELDKNKETLTKSEKYARIGFGVFLTALGGILLIRVLLG